MKLAKWLIAVGLVVALAPAAFAGNSRGGGAQKSQLYATSPSSCSSSSFSPGTHYGPSVGFVLLNSNGQPLNNLKDMIANIQLMQGSADTTYMVYVCSQSNATNNNGTVGVGEFTTDGRGHGHANIHVYRADLSSANPDSFYVKLQGNDGSCFSSDVLYVD